MPLTASAIPRALANEVIDELQTYNENIIAIAGALGTLKRRQITLDSKHMLRKYTEPTKISKEKLLEIDSISTITIRHPILFLPSITTITDERPVIKPKAAKHIHTAERAFNHGFVFTLDTALDDEWRGTEYVVEGWTRPSLWTTAG